MNYTKPMIDLVLEIRRRAPSGAKPVIKLANPDLLSELIPIYRDTTDNILRTMTRKLFVMAGDDWVGKLNQGSEDESRKDVKKVYGSHSSAIKVSSHVEKATVQRSDKVGVTTARKAPRGTPTRSQRIYRGQVVH